MAINSVDICDENGISITISNNQIKTDKTVVTVKTAITNYLGNAAPLTCVAAAYDNYNKLSKSYINNIDPNQFDNNTSKEIIINNLQLAGIGKIKLFFFNGLTNIMPYARSFDINVIQ